MDLRNLTLVPLIFLTTKPRKGIGGRKSHRLDGCSLPHLRFLSPLPTRRHWYDRLILTNFRGAGNRPSGIETARVRACRYLAHLKHGKSNSPGNRNTQTFLRCPLSHGSVYQYTRQSHQSLVERTRLPHCVDGNNK